ncbi:MAG TPA: flagellar motor protein MotB [Polyangia bacterium]|nr:flagellar motor protein MotB [Polyangia bacterium]
MSYNPNFDPSSAHLALKPKSNGPWVVAFLALAGAAAGGYYLHQGRQHARQDADAATRRAQAAEAEKTDLAGKVEKLESEKAELAKDKEELSKDVQAKTGELEQLKGTYDKLEDKMKDEIAKGDIRLSQSGGRLRVDLVDKILFDSGEAVISKRGEGVLSRVGAVLATMDDKQIQVSGHTDSHPISEKLAPQFPTNWELSTARAVNVVRFLQEKANVPAKNLVATGYGEYHPIASNKSSAGRARNRRIEILLTPSLDPKAMAKSKLRVAEAEAQAKADAKPEKAEAPSKPSKPSKPAKAESAKAKPKKQAKSGTKHHHG